jgi:hypothetical protein
LGLTAPITSTLTWSPRANASAPRLTRTQSPTRE